MTGILQICDPLWRFIDSVLFDLSPFLRLTLWGAFAGVLSIAIYRVISPQGRLKAYALEISRLKELLKHEVGTADRAKIIRRLLMLASLRVVLSLGPALAASMPVLLTVSYLDDTYHLQTVAAGQPVTVTARNGDSIEVEGGQKFSAGWTVNWPDGITDVRIFDSDGRNIYTLRSDSKPGTARKDGFLTNILGARLGRLPAESRVDVLVVETTPQPILIPELNAPFQWTIPYGVALMLASIVIKVAFRIS